jgi:predicted alpha/beta hydrolase
MRCCWRPEGSGPTRGPPLFYLGHSLGGQLLGVLPHNHLVSAAVTVTAGSGWYRFNDRMPLRVRTFWFAAIPSLTPLFGYFPGRVLRMVGDLPAGVARQWRRWALHPDYIHSESPRVADSFARVQAPVTGYSFEDDPIITRPAIDDLHRRYTGALVVRRHVHPREAGRGSIGHFGFFSEASREGLWPEMLAKLVESRARPPRGNGQDPA